MISNFWKGTSFYCMCDRHESPIPMVFKEGNSLFFACPKYMLADEQHPDGHERTEPACSNRLSYSDAEKIVSTLSDKVQDSIMEGEICDFTGYNFTVRKIKARVLKYKDDDIRIGVINKGVCV